MFLGHPATGFAAKRIVPRVSLGMLILAPMFLDLLWPVFLLLGIEHVRIDPGNTVMTPLDFYNYPWTHSLLMAVVWGAILGAIYFAVSKYSRGAWIVGLLVVSHWILDFVTHAPDLPLYPGGPEYGLEMWNNRAATTITEFLLLAIGFALYLSVTRARDRIGSIAAWTLVIFLALIFVGNVTSPPPPNAEMIAYVGLLQILFPIWGWWIDRHRQVR
jgi:hypothetical protein